jgi:hypothetical protein
LQGAGPAWNLRPTERDQDFAAVGRDALAAWPVEMLRDHQTSRALPGLICFPNSAMLAVCTWRTGAPLCANPTTCRRYMAQVVTCGWLNTIERA